jgi:hypothetical protein
MTLRILRDDATQTASSLTASNSAGTLAASNMATEEKGEVWRSTTTAATLTLQWVNATPVNMISFPWCNFSSTATIRIRGYSDLGTTLLFDTGAQSGKVFAPVSNTRIPSGVNGYAYGGASFATSYFSTANVKELMIDIADPSNPSGYLEAARLVCGQYYSYATTGDQGAAVGMDDRTTQQRSDAGSLRSDKGTRSKKVTFNLSALKAADRAEVWELARINGLTYPLFVSLTPASTDSSEEALLQIWGKMTASSSLTYQFFNAYSTQMEIEEN